MFQIPNFCENISCACTATTPTPRTAYVQTHPFSITFNSESGTKSVFVQGVDPTDVPVAVSPPVIQTDTLNAPYDRRTEPARVSSDHLNAVEASVFAHSGPTTGELSGTVTVVWLPVSS